MIAAKRLAAFSIVIAAILFETSNQSLGASAIAKSPDQIEGKTYRLERAFLISVHIPSASVNRVLQSLTAAVGLEYGSYAQVAYVDAEGVEQFRSLAGSKDGAQKEVDKVPSKVVTVSVIHDTAVLQKALDAINQAHSYEEPVIYITEGWRNRSTSPDEQNPNRWWNQQH